MEDSGCMRVCIVVAIRSVPLLMVLSTLDNQSGSCGSSGSSSITLVMSSVIIRTPLIDWYANPPINHSITCLREKAVIM